MKTVGTNNDEHIQLFMQYYDIFDIYLAMSILLSLTVPRFRSKIFLVISGEFLYKSQELLEEPF